PLHLLKQQWDVIDAFRDNGRDLMHPQSLTQSGICLQIWANGKLPGRACTRERGCIGDTAVEALLRENTPRELSPVQPTPMLGGVMPRQLSGDASCVGRLERCIQRCELMRMEIVQSNAHQRGLWRACVEPPRHGVGAVRLRT